MSDEEALIATIVGADCETAEERRARWAEDTPRLAYADWCDENGKPQRAELIRLQVEIKCHEGDEGPPKFNLNENPTTCKRCRGWYAGLGRCGCAYGDRRSAAWTKLVNDRKAWTHEFFARAARETELGRYCQDNREAFYNLPGEVVGLGDWKWERGFCNKLRIKYSDWYEHGDLILSRQPVEDVTLILSDDEWAAYRREHVNVTQASSYKWPGPLIHFQPQGNGTTLRMDEWLEMDETVLRTARERFRGIGNMWSQIPLPLPMVHQDFEFDMRSIEMARLDMMLPRLDPRSIIYNDPV